MSGNSVKKLKGSDLKDKLIAYNPSTPGRRGMVLYKPAVDKVKPLKSLLRTKKSTGGRNSQGRMTVRFRGGGHKQRYRIVNTKKNRELFDIPAVVQSIEYDPNRTAKIALIRYENGVMEYMVCPDGLKKGDTVMTSLSQLDIVVGNTMPAKFVPAGTVVHCAEIKPMSGAVFARSAGSYLTINGKERGIVNVTLSSKEMRVINGDCFVTIGVVSNPLKKNEKYGKAGKSRLRGRRPHVRGVAMNPVDHPLGGGEGKSSGGRHPVSPWGQPSKGLKTRNNKRTDKLIISRKKRK